MYTYHNLKNNTIFQKIINVILMLFGKLTGIYYYLLYLRYPTKTPDILLLTCIDYRLIDDYVVVLDELNLTNNYNQFSLAGASLAFTDDQNHTPFDFKAFQDVYYQHVNASNLLHSISKIYVIDHQDCGAYKEQYGHDDYALHVKNIRSFIKKVKKFIKINIPGKKFSYHGYFITLNRKLIRVA